jgi:AraC-like DNA-binding protein
LLIAPHLTVADYDLWGSYVLGAPTLRESLLRAVGSIGLHSNDSVAISVIDDATIKFTYDFGMRNEAGYEQIAPCAVGVISSIFKFYLGASWRPLAIDLDLPEPHDPFVFEDAFECPVHFGKPAVAVWFARQHLDAARPVEHAPFVTTADIERKRFGGTPTSATDKVMQLIMLQMLDGAPDLDDAAERMKIGPRTLQRALLSEGTSFRELANAAVAERSRELLSDSYLSVTEIAADLGYSSSAHFARAFRKQSGQSPSEFRTRWGARNTEPNAT